jgi:hypothetical protein
MLGFQLSSKQTNSSGDIVFPPKGKVVDLEEFARSVTKDAEVLVSLKKIAQTPSRVLNCLAYQFAEANVFIVIGDLGALVSPRAFTPLLTAYDAELTIEKPFIFWLIGDSKSAVERRVLERMVVREKRRSKSFKNTFTMALTTSTQVIALMNFLLEQVTGKTVT